MANHYPPFDTARQHSGMTYPSGLTYPTPSPAIDPFLAATYDHQPLASPMEEYYAHDGPQTAAPTLDNPWAPQQAPQLDLVGSTMGQSPFHRTYAFPNAFSQLPAHNLSPAPRSEDSMTAFPLQTDATMVLDTTPPQQQHQTPVTTPQNASAEEDKRRRNTEASARFRVKKKEREEALSRSATELAAKVTRLEARVEELERENRWLRGLIVGKGQAAGLDLNDKGNDKRAEKSRNDGVGTGAQDDEDDSDE